MRFTITIDIILKIALQNFFWVDWSLGWGGRQALARFSFKLSLSFLPCSNIDRSKLKLPVHRSSSG
jgi:hypothetical protein